MPSSDILVDTTNTMSARGSNSIKGLWDSRLRSYRGASADAVSSGSSPLASTPKRSTSAHVSKSGGSTSPSTGDLTDSEARPSALRSASAAPSSGGTVVSSGGAAYPRGRCSSALSLKRRASSSSPALAATPPSPAHRRQRSASPIAKPLFNSRYLLAELGPHEVNPILTVVLDLDETLVSNRSSHLSRAILRPYCLHVLHALRHMHGLEIVLWTASTKETASPVVEQLHALGPIFDEVIFRSDLWFTEPIHTKDLRALGRDMDRVVIVDNAANCCKLNPHNAILIDDFHGFRQEEDAALVNVYYVVEALLKLSNEGVPVTDGLAQLADEGNLCRPVILTIPEAWRALPLSEIAPLKIPPHGMFIKSNTPPPLRSIMKYWKY